MFIIPLPWSRSELQDLRDRSSSFDLLMDDSTQPCYLVIQANTITWLAQGTVPGKAAYQIKSRSSTMNGRRELPENLGNVGFLGTYSGIEDAVRKLFPRNGYCVSNMKFMAYTGQSLKGNKDHYNVIEPILCLLGTQPSADLQHFFQIIGWGKQTPFDCTGTWRENMQLLEAGCKAPTLEAWFTNYCSIALA